MRKLVLILLSVELLLAIALGQVGDMHRPKMARAFTEWQQHPTVETRQAFEQEKRITEYERWALSGVVFAVLAGTTFLIYWLRRGEPGAGENRRGPLQIYGF